MTASRLDRYRLIVDQGLREYFPVKDERAKEVYDAMEHSLFSGGKRFRPILTLLCAEAIDAKISSVLPIACAIEFVHTYSLIHDDLPAMDDDDLRRGKPACHMKFSESTAILAGDGLMAEAFSLISKNVTGLGAEIVVEIVREISDAIGAGGMVGGQLIDIELTGVDTDYETIKYMHSLKTGRLITAAARSGAIADGASKGELEAISDYASDLGLAFQIRDDILDIEGNTDEMGKTSGSDVRRKKSTFPSIVGVLEAKNQLKEIIDRAKLRLDGEIREKNGLLELADLAASRIS